VSAEQKSMTEEISTLSCTHPTFLKIILFIFSSFIFFIYFFTMLCRFLPYHNSNFIYFCLHLVFIAVHGFSCWGAQALMHRLQRLQPMGSVVAAPRLWSTGPTVMVHRLSCSTYGIFLDQGPNLCLLHWQVDSFTTEPPGKPTSHIKFLYFVVSDQAHVHLSFQSSTSHRCGVSPCCQSSHHTGLK